jgi:hypothetical protein
MPERSEPGGGLGSHPPEPLDLQQIREKLPNEGIKGSREASPGGLGITQERSIYSL